MKLSSHSLCWHESIFLLRALLKLNPFLQVPVSRWGRLDASTPYDDYASKGSSEEICRAVQAFKPDVFMIVDWSALDLYRNLRQKMSDQSSGQHIPLSDTPLVYLNYRVFSRTEKGDELTLVSR
jgi:hypothetical protein